MPKTVLVVEDDPDARGLIETILKLSGFKVVLASDGREGPGKAQLELPDLIITDIAMPRLNGLGMIHELRDSPNLKNITHPRDHILWNGKGYGRNQSRSKSRSGEAGSKSSIACIRL